MKLKLSWQKKLELLSKPGAVEAFTGIRRGLEKESLRVNTDSRIATTMHPTSLGSPLTHSWITTDYAEALMEFITPAGTNAQQTIEILKDIHKHVYHHIGEELLWPLSMPSTIETKENIQLAYYGESNIGKTKTVYRTGLKNRYGSMMQIISGVHYNFSMPDSFWPVWQQVNSDQQALQDFISQSYLGLVRNFFRIGWLIPYLFGASPAVDSSFLRYAGNNLPWKNIGKSSHYLPSATSLRMSSLGYNAKEQEDLAISYNSLAEFVGGLRQATSQSNPVFEKIGVKRGGEYQQLNTHTLQQEGELYAPIRPKRVIQHEEKLSDALENRGVQYVEIRSLDVNPYAEVGIDLEQMKFLDVFLVCCLLKDSPDLSCREQGIISQNMKKVTLRGREKALELRDGENLRPLTGWAEEIFAELVEVAGLLDETEQNGSYLAAVHSQYEKLLNPSLTPSARLIEDMQKYNIELNELALRLAENHKEKLVATDYMQIQPNEFSLENTVSHLKQRRLEGEDTLSFDEYHSLTYGRTPAPGKSPRRRKGQGNDKCQCDSPKHGIVH